MKIVIPILAFTRSGGARVLAELAAEWVRQGHEVDFLCASADSEPYFPTLARIQRGKCVTTDGVTRQLFELTQLIRKNAVRADAILANFHLTVWAVWAAGSLARRRSTYYMQAYEVDFYDENPSRLRRLILRTLARGSLGLLPRLVVNSPIYLDYPGVHAIGWVPPGLDFARFWPRAAAFAVPVGGPVTIGCIGRLERWKGTGDVVAAVEILVQRGVDVRLRIAYHCPDVLPTNVRSLTEQVVPRDDSELADFYRGCDILIAPATIQLGAPHYPVMEAMACNVPVITTGYIPANTDNALIVPVRSPDAIADAVELAVADVDATEARAAKAQLAIAEFSWPAVASRMLMHLGTPVAS